MDNLIVFKAYSKKRQTPVKLSPLEDKTGKLFTGQGKYGYFELLTEEEKRALPYIVTHDTIVSLLPGDSLNLSDPVDSINWEWVKKHPYIALDEETGLSSRDAVLFVEDLERSAELAVRKDKTVTIAKAKIYSASNARKILLAKALGNVAADSLSTAMLEEYLIEKAILSPAIIVKYLDEKNKSLVEAKAFIEELKLNNLLIRYAGSWKYGGKDGVTVGSTDENTIEYIGDKKNAEQVFIMKERLKELKSS